MRGAGISRALLMVGGPARCESSCSAHGPDPGRRGLLSWSVLRIGTAMFLFVSSLLVGWATRTHTDPRRPKRVTFFSWGAPYQFSCLVWHQLAIGIKKQLPGRPMSLALPAFPRSTQYPPLRRPCDKGRRPLPRSCVYPRNVVLGGLARAPPGAPEDSTALAALALVSVLAIQAVLQEGLQE